MFSRLFSQTSNSPLSVLESSVISEIATPISSCASSALNQKNFANNDGGSSSNGNNNNNSPGGNESKLSSALSGSRSNGLGGSKPNIVIELKEDLKPRRPLRPRPRSEVNW